MNFFKKLKIKLMIWEEKQWIKGNNKRIRKWVKNESENKDHIEFAKLLGNKSVNRIIKLQEDLVRLQNSGRLIQADEIYCRKCEKEMFLDGMGGGSIIFRCDICNCEVELEA